MRATGDDSEKQFMMDRCFIQLFYKSLLSVQQCPRMIYQVIAMTNHMALQISAKEHSLIIFQHLIEKEVTDQQ